MAGRLMAPRVRAEAIRPMAKVLRAVMMGYSGEKRERILGLNPSRPLGNDGGVGGRAGDQCPVPIILL
ncbi:hypothetical protein GCM10027256_31840 [Novispirillum itersonii subsp. nipponicum]